MVQIHQIQTVQNGETVSFYVFYSQDGVKLFNLLSLEQLEELKPEPQPAQEPEQTIPPLEETQAPE